MTLAASVEETRFLRIRFPPEPDLQQVAKEECITVTASLSAQNVVDDSGSFRPGVQRLRTLAKSVREVAA